MKIVSKSVLFMEAIAKAAYSSLKKLLENGIRRIKVFDCVIPHDAHKLYRRKATLFK